MTVTEQLGSLGAWSLTLADGTPRAVTDQLGFFGHIGIWTGRVDVDQADDAALLAAARYVGVLREKPTGRTSLEGAGMLYWLGDEDGKGAVFETPVVFTAASLTSCVTRLLPPAVALGTVHDPGGTYTGTHQWQTPRAVLDTITAAFGVEYRVNPNGTVDVGTAAQLYPGGSQAAIISARGAGNDFNLASLGADFKTDTGVVDYTSRLVLLGQKNDAAGNSASFVEAAANAAVLPYKDLRGNTVHITRAVSDQGQTDASAPAAAQLELNAYNRTKTALTITASDYEMSGQPLVGQMAYVFDPDNGLVDPATQIDFRGDLIYPQAIRISALQWPLTDGMTVAFRTQNGVWVDLTRYVEWDAQGEQITVGDLPRTLTSGSNPVLTQTQSAPDASVPAAPTGLALTTTSYESSVGQSTATITASWTAPALNTDGSVLTDLSHYLVQYRWHGRAPLWDTRIAPTTTIDIPGLSVGLVYDVQVAAVDTTGHVSAFTAVAQITAAPDQTAPNAPSDPIVGSYLGQLRIAWDGKDNTGAAMPPDFAVVEVHVSSSSGFTPVGGPGSATLVSQLSTAGVAYATAPYGALRYVKLVAVDNSGNRSAPSNQVSGTTTQVADGDIASLNVGKLTAGTMSADVVIAGRFATALTGARVEVNALGFQKFAADGTTKLISLTGTEALLTGVYKTALTGRRVEIGSAGALGEIDFLAPDGTKTLLRAFTEGTGVESIQFGVPIAANSAASADSLWNRWHANSDEWAQARANKVDLMYGTHRSSAPGFFVVRESPDRGQTAFSRLYIGPNDTFLVGNSNSNTRLALDSTSFSYFESGGQERLAIGGVFEVISNAAGGVDQFMQYNLTGSDAAHFYLWGDSVSGVANAQAQFNHYGAGNTECFMGASEGSWKVLLDGSGHTAASPNPTSPLLQLFTGDSYGIHFRTFHDSRGALMEVRYWDNSGFAGLRASVFEVNSQESSKTDIADFRGALELVRGLRMRSYSRRDVHGPVAEEELVDAHRGKGRAQRHTGRALRPAHPVGGPKTIGLVAEEAPDLVRRDNNIDLYSLTSLSVAGVQELDAEHNALAERVADLERLVKRS